MAGYSKNSDGTYSVNYEDERFQQIENEKVQEIQKTENMYDNMITNSDKYYQAQIDASKEWADKQSELQQQKTDLLLEQTQQQKDKAEKDYIKEQKGAYQDYLKQTDAYGVNAERLAASGLANSGYSETSKVRMYNAYQNRYATARESYNQAVLNYDNSMKEAILANNEQLATISFNALQQQLELSLQGFQYKNELLLTKEQQVNQTKQTYYNRYQDVLSQINTEIQYQMETDKILEDSRRWLKEFEATQAQREKENAQWEQEYALKEKQAERDYQLALAAERRAAAEHAYNLQQRQLKAGIESLGTEATKLLKTLKQAKLDRGKGWSNWHGDDSIRANLYLHMESDKISENEADIIAEALGV